MKVVKEYEISFDETYVFLKDNIPWRSATILLSLEGFRVQMLCRRQVGAIDELHPHPMGGGKLKFLESYNISDVEEGPLNSADQFADNTDSLIRLVEPEITSTIDMTPENTSLGSDSLEMDNDSLSSAKAGFDDFLGEVRDSINTSINNGGNVVQSSLDTITSSITSIKEGASEAVDVEKSIAKGASFVVYSYGPAKDFLPPEIRSALNLSEERVYIAIEGLEKSLGLDPNDPIVPFVLFLGTSATLWGFYRVWVYGGYSGDLSPQLILKLLPGKEDAILIDVRPEARDKKISNLAPSLISLFLPLNLALNLVDIVYMKVLRERDGIPDLRRATRFRYAIVTLPEVDGPVRKLLKGGRYLDDILIAAVIRNLKAVQHQWPLRTQEIVLVLPYAVQLLHHNLLSVPCLNPEAGTLSQIYQRPYLVQGGFHSWVKQGIQAKKLKPETMLTILNEEAEAILEDIRPSPMQTLRVGEDLTIYCHHWPQSDVQNWVLQAAAKHESQPSETEVPNPSPESVTPLNEKVDLSEA
ncbi:hypothetical protein NC651_039918 [Populus alba x Populus x berolinensis]|nr:hypothetical protein NC651_039918 [Populus alba x Populus x berolinensis]